ncbi:trigger factor [Lachnoclostridium phytofermentans]|uniref:Trigger factor n=1 Tax=Lachnoclostridium phytofermentans (strain ATCC 700394 / DSM 18823 / ISDg) TaxID=357809 RepID=TIG_LACP7|nr:trigger factor [Lachnoclostridium phytofermentans]A9KSW9.1 RecName: Full=Trigger factor; Short=TF; AltName: Full=PPIase [Lachnoclostridium phytofermentans ISDg]ABX40763.1 trigger factor [Lachnoclostridium phytofermentans ISDg]
MSFKVEDLGKNMVKLTIEATAEDFDKAIEQAYQKNKGKMNVQGFRKGKAPRAIIEKMYGVGVFYEDAANFIIPEAYEQAIEESKLDVVARPEIDVVQVEKGQPFIFTAEVAVKPEVTLGAYKGVEVSKSEIEVTEDEIMAELDKVREQNSRTITVEDRAVMDKDIVTIDFEGFVDGVAFEGGKGEDYALTIGSHSFIDTFEDQLVGKNIGEDVEVNVTFPTEYHAADLAGKPALFKVKVKEIKAKELPAADDEFAGDVSEFNTLEEYKADLKKSLTEKKDKAAKTAKEDAVVDKVIENATMEIPDAMVDTQKRQMAEDFAQRLKMQGLSLEQYFQFTGLNPNTFMENLGPQALKRIQSRLVLEAVVKAENITVSVEEIDKELAEMASAYQMEVDKLKELIGEKEKEQIVMDMAVQKAIDLVASEAKEV